MPPRDFFRIALIALSALFGVTVALAFVAARADPQQHRPQHWIDQGGYIAKDGHRCCGHEDCLPVPAANIVSTPKGYSFVSPFDADITYSIPYEDAQPSEDQRHWACIDLYSKNLRCFFRLSMGS